MQYASLLSVPLLIWDTLTLKKKGNCSNMIQSRICPRSHGAYTTAATVWQFARFKKVVTIKKLSRTLTTASQNLLFKFIHEYLVSFVRRCHIQILFFFWPPPPLRCISLYSSWALHLLCLVSCCHVFPKKKNF